MKSWVIMVKSSVTNTPRGVNIDFVSYNQ